MRTTLSIDDRLLEEAKAQAVRRGQTLGQYVEDALRAGLTRDETGNAPSIPVFTRGTGMRAGIDPSSNRALYDALDEAGDLS
ncbi:MAG TPA: hypothetical protein VNT50_10350 [Microbacterium sp.]|uniref:hypothetical protein n=1 Tax=Microbacterium sp. TaxID=51671 RepID=UPI002C1ECF92|nr:hypothetical protein [Microbacterium sp.]HWI31882.1 hypothetical protein [Microbacterium sp.]